MNGNIASTTDISFPIYELMFSPTMDSHSEQLDGNHHKASSSKKKTRSELHDELYF
jgi:hypothetical protein